MELLLLHAVRLQRDGAVVDVDTGLQRVLRHAVALHGVAHPLHDAGAPLGGSSACLQRGQVLQARGERRCLQHAERRQTAGEVECLLLGRRDGRGSLHAGPACTAGCPGRSGVGARVQLGSMTALVRRTSARRQLRSSRRASRERFWNAAMGDVAGLLQWLVDAGVEVSRAMHIAVALVRGGVENVRQLGQRDVDDVDAMLQAAAALSSNSSSSSSSEGDKAIVVLAADRE